MSPRPLLALSRAFAVSLLAAPLFAQAPPAEAASSALRRAETSIASGDDEAAAAAVREAALHVERVPNTDKQLKKDLDKQVSTLGRRVDSKSAKVVAARVRAATDLLKLVAHYEKRGWDDTTLELLELAERLHPGTATKRLAAAQERAAGVPDEEPATGPITISNDLLVDWFGQGYTRLGEDEWRFTATDGATSPPRSTRDKRGFQLRLARKRLVDDHRVRVQIKVPSGGIGALCFGIRPSQEGYFRLDVDRANGPARAVLLQIGDDGVFRPLKTAALELDDAQQNDWIQLEVEVRRTKIRVRAASRAEPVEFEASADVGGEIGFLVPPEAKTDELVSWRFLQLERL